MRHERNIDSLTSRFMLVIHPNVEIYVSHDIDPLTYHQQTDDDDVDDDDDDDDDVCVCVCVCDVSTSHYIT